MILPAMLSALGLAMLIASHAHQFVGRATVVDGDTIDIQGERIRLNGIDAPESWQRCQDAGGEKYPCGRVAALALDSFLALSRPVTCHYEARDRYGRTVATCYRADGQEVNAWLVRQGHALDFKRYSKGRYRDEEAAARSSRSGIWRGTFEDPAEVRRRRRSS